MVMYWLKVQKPSQMKLKNALKFTENHGFRGISSKCAFLQKRASFTEIIRAGWSLIVIV